MAQTVMAVVLLSILGLMIVAAPRRKRFGRRSGRSHGAGGSSIDGEENSANSSFAGDGGGGDGGDGGGGDGGGGD